MQKIIRITEQQYNHYVNGKDLINEIKHIAVKSNITVTSLENFKEIVRNLGVNDNNVEQYLGKYCFIEIGSSLSRLKAEVPHIPSVNDDNGNAYNADDLYNKGQWGFSSNHKNVLKLEFDDNQKFNNKMPKGNGFDGNTPATAVKLSSDENIYGKEGFKFYYENGADFTNEMANQLKQFVDSNLKLNPNVKFIIHCKQGKSRSAAIGMYVANKIGQFGDDFLSEYDTDDNNSQFNIGMSRKKTPKYPHKNVMTKMGEIEGWSDSKKPTKDQWFYDTLTNHPNTGFNAKKQSQSESKKIVITSEQFKMLNEDVYIKSKNDKNNTAQLTYKQRDGGSGRNKGNLSSIDMLKTDKMDDNTSETYPLRLKGGFMSFNITDINGTEVMHYFKRKFDHEKTQIKLGNEKYDLEMEDNEFKQFMNNFLNKVNNVVNSQINEFKQNNKDISFNEVSIYPVPSSSNFNDEMAKRIANKHTISGLHTNIVNRDLLKKNTNNLQIDDDFINKNKEYYNSKRFEKGSSKETHMQALNTEMNKLKRLPEIKKQIDMANEFTKIENRQQTGSLLRQWNYVRTKMKDGSLTKKALIKLDELFTQYQDAVNKIVEVSEYYSEITNDTKYRRLSSIASAIAYSKGPSIKGRSEEIYNLLRQNGLGKNINKKLNDVCMWKPENFQIKKLGNDIRMGLKNYFQPNEKEDLVQNEITKINNGVVVIFDDNVSGGATLGDICLQLKNLGIKFIIPITFGRMRASYNQKTQVINKPTNDKFNF